MALGIHVKGVLAAIVVLFLLTPQSANTRTSVSRPHQQDTASVVATSHGDLPMLSDREKGGLRGPVEECTLETITPPGPNSRAWRMVYITKYDPDGRMYEHGYVNNDGSKGTDSLTYDTEGHLLREVWDSQHGTSDTVYTYDVNGRLISITGPRDWSTTFEYDDQGRKTRIVRSQTPSSTNTHAPFGVNGDSEDLFIVPPVGGTVRTSFNERDQATESQVYTASGDLYSRFARAYDAKGRVTELSYVIENVALLLAPDARKRLTTEPGAAEEMNRKFVVTRTSYSYDAEGRLAEKHERTGFARERITKIIYNDHSDKIQEITTASGALNPPKNKEGELSPGSPQRPDLPDERSDVRFDYKYDSFGNWVEQTVSSASGQNELPGTWSISHRTITYY